MSIVFLIFLICLFSPFTLVSPAFCDWWLIGKNSLFTAILIHREWSLYLNKKILQKTWKRVLQIFTALLDAVDSYSIPGHVYKINNNIKMKIIENDISFSKPLLTRRCCFFEVEFSLTCFCIFNRQLLDKKRPFNSSINYNKII